MSENNSIQLATKIWEFFKDGRVCLFAGAGVSARAGIRCWYEYLTYLASVAEKYEPLTAELMRARVSAGDYTAAAHYYKFCTMIPRGEIFRHLSEGLKPEGNYEPTRLRSLLALPFSGVVTTNYDRSLHDAAHSLLETKDESGVSIKSPIPIELGDTSLRHGIYCKDFFIARIHGRMEYPETIMLDTEDYASLAHNSDYRDYVLHVVKNYRCLWVGFSFMDPAITCILGLMSDSLKSGRHLPHLALLPSSADGGLVTKLAAFNIATEMYSPQDNHNCLWSAVKSAQKKLRTVNKNALDRSFGYSGVKRFLAFTYSRLSLGSQVQPLLETVVQGFIVQLLSDTYTAGASLQEISLGVADNISAREDKLVSIITKGLRTLLMQEAITVANGKYFLKQPCVSQFDAAVGTLVNGIVDRLHVREGLKVNDSERNLVRDMLENILYLRGWDLGAHFASGQDAPRFSGWKEIEALAREMLRHTRKELGDVLPLTIIELFTSPEDGEANILADLGRVSFGVELVLNNASFAIDRARLLPRILFLDANVIMPAIVDGHPYRPVYADTILQLQKAVASKGEQVLVATAREFLNEIISHRRNAVDEVASLGLEKQENLKKHLLFYGAENTNVFVGAYASWVGRLGVSLTFRDYLRKYAPYTDETSLQKFLEKQGIQVESLHPNSDFDIQRMNRMRVALHGEYNRWADENETRLSERKPTVLVNHEADQLARLLKEKSDGKDVLFVTADKRLLRLCCNSKSEELRECSEIMVTQLGLVQLVDIILGGEVDKRSLARIMWNVGIPDDAAVIRDYIIDRALQSYDEGLAMATWEIAGKIAEEAARSAKRENLRILRTSRDDKARVAAFLDRVEQDFYRNMREMINKKEKPD